MDDELTKGNVIKDKPVESQNAILPPEPPIVDPNSTAVQPQIDLAFQNQEVQPETMEEAVTDQQKEDLINKRSEEMYQRDTTNGLENILETTTQAAEKARTTRTALEEQQRQLSLGALKAQQEYDQSIESIDPALGVDSIEARELARRVKSKAMRAYEIQNAILNNQIAAEKAVEEENDPVKKIQKEAQLQDIRRAADLIESGKAKTLSQASAIIARENKYLGEEPQLVAALKSYNELIAAGATDKVETAMQLDGVNGDIEKVKQLLLSSGEAPKSVQKLIEDYRINVMGQSPEYAKELTAVETAKTQIEKVLNGAGDATGVEMGSALAMIDEMDKSGLLRETFASQVINSENTTAYEKSMAQNILRDTKRARQQSIEDRINNGEQVSQAELKSYYDFKRGVKEAETIKDAKTRLFDSVGIVEGTRLLTEAARTFTAEEEFLRSRGYVEGIKLIEDAKREPKTAQEIFYDEVGFLEGQKLLKEAQRDPKTAEERFYDTVGFAEGTAILEDIKASPKTQQEKFFAQVGFAEGQKILQEIENMPKTAQEKFFADKGYAEGMSLIEEIQRDPETAREEFLKEVGFLEGAKMLQELENAPKTARDKFLEKVGMERGTKILQELENPQTAREKFLNEKGYEQGMQTLTDMEVAAAAKQKLVDAVGISGAESIIGENRQLDSILKQIEAGEFIKSDTNDYRDRFFAAGRLDDFDKAITSPRNKLISETTASKAMTPKNITRGNYDKIIKARQDAGYGNEVFQSMAGDDRDSLGLMVQMKNDLIAMKVLKIGNQSKEGKAYWDSLTEDQRSEIRFNYNLPESFGEVNTGKLAKTQLGVAEFFGGGDPQKIALDTLSGKYTVKYMKDISGVAISEKERQMLSGLLPGIGVEDKRFEVSTRDALKVVNNNLERNASGYGFKGEDDLRIGLERVKSPEYFNMANEVLANIADEAAKQNTYKEGGDDTVEFIKGSEGFSANTYDDYKQTSSGYGTKAKFPGEQITEQEAEKRMNDVITRNKEKIQELFPNGLSSSQSTALNSFMYNLGVNIFQKPEAQKLYNAILSGDEETISEEWPKYSYAGGKFNQGLYNRRIKELNKFFA